MEFFQVDVFADAAYMGNPLAVFPDATDLSAEQMQKIAREMNLSETSFVTSTAKDSYTVRIFTPSQELPFAGHPTLGTAWMLRELGLVEGDAVTQRSQSGDTPVTFKGDYVWLERSGESGEDLVKSSVHVNETLADALNIDPGDVGMEAREFGRPGRLEAAQSSAAYEMLMVPVRNLDALGRVRLDPVKIEALSDSGAYCFTAEAAGRLRARGMFPLVGVAEDPATGVACASLGIYLAARMGAIEFEVRQGIEIGRPSRLLLKASVGTVAVGGSCTRIFKGDLEVLP